MRNKKFVYAYKNVHNTVSIVNYDTDNKELNVFLGVFNIYGTDGELKSSGENKEIWFECPLEIWDMLHTKLFEDAFWRLGTKLVFEYPYKL